jgi:hypothetical protein
MEIKSRNQTSMLQHRFTDTVFADAGKRRGSPSHVRSMNSDFARRLARGGKTKTRPYQSSSSSSSSASPAAKKRYVMLTPY